MANAWDDLFDRLEAADVAAMSYEEREAVADAIHSGSLEDAALSPRARILAEELAALVAKPDPRNYGSRGSRRHADRAGAWQATG